MKRITNIIFEIGYQIHKIGTRLMKISVTMQSERIAKLKGGSDV